MASARSTKKEVQSTKSTARQKTEYRDSGKRTSGSSKKSSGKSSGRRTSARADSGSKKNRGRNSDYVDYRVGQEIRICITAVISIMLLLANFGLVGRAGSVVSSAMFGTFGLMAYAIPFILFFGHAFFVANSGNPLIWRKMAGFILTLIFMCAFMQLLTVGYVRVTDLREYYRVSMDDRTGGGIVGGTVIWAFGSLFGTIGAYVLTVAGLVVAIIILTQRPLLTSLGKKSTQAARVAREKGRVRRERREEERRAEKERKDRLTGDDLYEDLQEDYGEDPLKLVTLKPVKTKKKDSVKKQPLPEKPVSTIDRDALFKAVSGELATAKKDETVFQMPSFLRGMDGRGLSFENESSGEPDGPDLLDMEISGASDSKSEPAGDISMENASAGPDVKIKKRGTLRTLGGTEEEIRPDEDTEAEKYSAKASRKIKKKPQERDVEASEIMSEIESRAPEKPKYELPSVRLLSKGKAAKGDSRQHMMDTAAKLQTTLANFGVDVKVVNVSRGPTVTRYELQPEQGVKVSRIINLQDDIKLNLAAAEIRIEAPIPGKAAVGIEVPNKDVSPVMLRDIIDCEEFAGSRASLPFAVGKDLGGRPVITDIEKMPHLLIAGATGSGKSVCINTLIMSILYRCTPDDVRMLMIDPKVVELKIYDGIPHLLIPVVTDARKAAGALNWAVQEMTRRYNLFASIPGVRDIKSYNERIKKSNVGNLEADKAEPLPRIIVIVDELADLMMVASGEVEDAICRLAQLARAAGIHLIIATQRPSVNVVTGLIKANMPSRIALAVTSGIDSRTILDMNGAEKLLGKGDMLFYPQGLPKPARVQGAYVSDEDISAVVEFLIKQMGDDGGVYLKDVEERIEAQSIAGPGASPAADDGRDEFFADAGRLIIEKEKASIGMLQRAFKIGFNRAARVMDQLADAGVVGGEEGTKPRKILMSMEEFESMLLSENGP